MRNPTTSPFRSNPCLIKTCDGYHACVGKCEAARVKCNAVLCENRACEFCCGKFTGALETVGGEWEVDLSKNLPHVAIGMPHLPHLPHMHMPSSPMPGLRGILRGRGAGGEAGEGTEEAEGTALTQTQAPEAVTWEENMTASESLKNLADNESGAAADDDGQSQGGASSSGAPVNMESPRWGCTR
jgi:hypothetical protein